MISQFISIFLHDRYTRQILFDTSVTTMDSDYVKQSYVKRQSSNLSQHVA